MATPVRRAGAEPPGRGGSYLVIWGPGGAWGGGTVPALLGVRLALRGELSPSPARLLSLSAAHSASRAGDGPGPRAGVPGPAVASALGVCGSPWLGAHGRRPPFPRRGERAAVCSGAKGGAGEGILPIPTHLSSPDPRGSPQHCICQS